jgi:hypothetical protein
MENGMEIQEQHGTTAFGCENGRETLGERKIK